jgi:hypothetical protein
MQKEKIFTSEHVAHTSHLTRVQQATKQTKQQHKWLIGFVTITSYWLTGLESVKVNIPMTCRAEWRRK